jgi:uncharacterized protein
VTYLLDVNLLIALCDNYHAHHEAARRWFKAGKGLSWATCPLTENGFIRITSRSNYPFGHGTVSMQRDTLQQLCSLPGHTFWPDDLSLRQPEIWTQADLVNPAHLTDLYLLALAVKNGGRLASFDRRMPSHFIRRGKEALHVISA